MQEGLRAKNAGKGKTEKNPENFEISEECRKI